MKEEIGSVALEQAVNLMIKVASEKARSITITINNKAQCSLKNLRVYMASGNIDNYPPHEIQPGHAGVFDVCSKPGLMGVKGAITYQAQGNDFVIFFKNPYAGGNWHGVGICEGVKQVYQRYQDVNKTKANQSYIRQNQKWKVYSLAGGGKNSKQQVTLWSK